MLFFYLHLGATHRYLKDINRNIQAKDNQVH